VKLDHRGGKRFRQEAQSCDSVKTCSTGERARAGLGDRANARWLASVAVLGATGHEDCVIGGTAPACIVPSAQERWGGVNGDDHHGGRVKASRPQSRKDIAAGPIPSGPGYFIATVHGGWIDDEGAIYTAEAGFISRLQKFA
jgi:hypothetical protein